MLPVSFDKIGNSPFVSSADIILTITKAFVIILPFIIKNHYYGYSVRRVQQDDNDPCRMSQSKTRSAVPWKLFVVSSKQFPVSYTYDWRDQGVQHFKKGKIIQPFTISVLIFLHNLERASWCSRIFIAYSGIVRTRSDRLSGQGSSETFKYLH